VDADLTATLTRHLTAMDDHGVAAHLAGF